MIQTTHPKRLKGTVAMEDIELTLIADSVGVLIDEAPNDDEVEFTARELIGASLMGIAALPSLAGVILAGQTLVGQ